MPADGLPSSPMRGALDVLLRQARHEWDRSRLDDTAVVLVASLDDVELRIRATAAAAWSRGQGLLEDGWTIEFRNLTDESIPWSAADGLMLIPDEPSDDGAEPPVIAEEDLPPLPPTAIDRLRDTA